MSERVPPQIQRVIAIPSDPGFRAGRGSLRTGGPSRHPLHPLAEHRIRHAQSGRAPLATRGEPHEVPRRSPQRLSPFTECFQHPHGPLHRPSASEGRQRSGRVLLSQRRVRSFHPVRHAGTLVPLLPKRDRICHFSQ